VLCASDLGVLALAGLDRVAIYQRPRIGLVLAGRGLDQTPDADGPMPRALIARDGGDVTATRRVGRDRAALREALRAPGCDAIVAVGGTGHGADDHAVSVLSEIGVVALADIAINPGGTAAIGRTSEGACVLLLPGRPAACLWAYELIAGRALRRLAGRDPSLPFAQRPLTLDRKIVSAIGLTEICAVRQTADGRIEPVAAFARASLMALAQADGFVVVPEGSEGFAAGATVPVYLLSTAS
jgi:molybdopterin molybdotransferase